VKKISEVRKIELTGLDIEVDIMPPYPAIYCHYNVSVIDTYNRAIGMFANGATYIGIIFPDGKYGFAHTLDQIKREIRLYFKGLK